MPLSRAQKSTEQLQARQNGRVTPIKNRSERKKGASVGIHTTRLLLIRSCALKVAHHRKRQQLLNKNQEFPSEIWTHRFVCCAVPLAGVVPFPWAGSFHFSRLPALRWQVIYIRQIQWIPMEESHPCDILDLLSLVGQRIHLWPAHPSTLAMQLQFLFPKTMEDIFSFFPADLPLMHARIPLQSFNGFYINNKYFSCSSILNMAEKIAVFHTPFIWPRKCFLPLSLSQKITAQITPRIR